MSEPTVDMVNRNEEIDGDTMPELLVITGMSGAGRTEAIHIVEDLGYYCIDNLPAVMLDEAIGLERAASTEDKPLLAVVCDARNGDHFLALIDKIHELAASGVDCRILFLDSSDEKLLARYKSSRRRHPFCTDGTTVAQGIALEREYLSEVRAEATDVIDTTDMLPQQLRQRIRDIFAPGQERQGLAVTVYSFGFKHGAPLDADIVMDVRFLPNPFYDPELRPKTGLDPEVRDFVLYRPETQTFLNRWYALLDAVMPGFVEEGKQQLAIAVGCTGGQHRSVVLAEATGEYLKSLAYRVSVAHRDLFRVKGAKSKSEQKEEAR